jgi:hypothetical protein
MAAVVAQCHALTSRLVEGCQTTGACCNLQARQQLRLQQQSPPVAAISVDHDTAYMCCWAAGAQCICDALPEHQGAWTQVLRSYRHMAAGGG